MLTWSACSMSITFYFSHVNKVLLDERKKFSLKECLPFGITIYFPLVSCEENTPWFVPHTAAVCTGGH